MRLDTAIKMLLDEYDEKIELLKREYAERILGRSVTPDGEASLMETLEINMWQVQEKNRIENELIAGIGRYVDLTLRVAI